MPTVKKIIAWVWVLIACSLSLIANGNDLAQLINDRLDLMDEVAAYKLINKRPIEDPGREEIVLQHAIFTGLEYGIKKESSELFFTQQIEAAKEIQRYWFKVWQTQTPPVEPPDLNRVIRPELIRLGNAISKELSDAGDIPLEEFLEVVDVKGLSLVTKQALHKAISNIEPYDNRLQQALDSGVLRVGTTGDYAPFSYRPDLTGKITGIDIDLAQDLASSLQVELRLVHTSWPTLLQDLNANLFDIAMSGVSRNLERQKSGFFSSAYHVGGKTPVSLCKNISAFDSLEKIDAAGNHIIVNPGGTNERFVDSQIKFARKITHNDNRTIFEEIIHGNADLMITDSIEVRLQTSIHPELCATMPEKNLTYQEKGFLMPQDIELKEYVDLWLATRKADGTVEAIFDKFLR